MSTETESFLARWARRKREAERTAERVADALAAPAPAKPAGECAPAGTPLPTAATTGDAVGKAELPLPPIESLDGLRSDYEAFFQQPVAEELRHAALKKLFADPHFNQMDMLDVYVDDYTQFEPLPAELRMRLPSARDFLLDSERAAVEREEAVKSARGVGAESTLDPTAGSDATAAQAQQAADGANSDSPAQRPHAESPSAAASENDAGAPAELSARALGQSPKASSGPSSS